MCNLKLKREIQNVNIKKHYKLKEDINNKMEINPLGEMASKINTHWNISNIKKSPCRKDA